MKAKVLRNALRSLLLLLLVGFLIRMVIVPIGQRGGRDADAAGRRRKSPEGFAERQPDYE